MQGHYQLRISITDWDNTTIYATYDYFKIGSPEEMYTLQALAFSGTTGRMRKKYDNVGSAVAQWWSA